jgi:hypothetical protein
VSGGFRDERMAYVAGKVHASRRWRSSMTQSNAHPREAALLPCPFCGGEADLRGHKAPEFWVGCSAIGCKATTEGFGDKARSIAAWNTRKPLPADALDGELVRRIVHVAEGNSAKERFVRQANLTGYDWRRLAAHLTAGAAPQDAAQGEGGGDV